MGIIYAGWDPGYGANKFARVYHGELITYVLTSAVGEANRGKKDGLTLVGGVVRPQRAARRPFQVPLTTLNFWSVHT